MKRGMIAMMGCLVATVALAQSPSSVHSVNVVGFQKKTVQGGKLYLVSSAFEDIDGKTLTAQDVLGRNAMAANSKVHWYDPTANGGIGGYRTENQLVNGNWTTNSIVFRGDMSFWVQPAGTNTFELVIKGQVPDGALTQTAVARGLNQLGFPYTASFPFTSMAVAVQANVGDKVHTWNETIQNWVTFQKLVNRTWNNGGSAYNVNMGTGFFLQTTNNWTANQGIPYTL